MRADRFLLASAALGLFGCGSGSAPTSPTPPFLPAPAPAPPPPPAPGCETPSLEVLFLRGNQAAGIARGALTLEAAHPATALDFIRPYPILVPSGGENLDIPGLRPTVGVFVSDLRFEHRENGGFRQTMTVEWLSEFSVRAIEPDCEPVVVVVCGDQECGPGSDDS